MTHSVKALHTGCVAVLLLHVATAMCWLSAGVFSEVCVGLQCWQPVSWDGPQQLVLRGFFALERQTQASSSQAPGGMFDAGKGCQLQSFTNLPFCNV